MAEKSTYVKLDRNIIDWGWFKRASVLQVFIWLIVKANYEDHRLEKYLIRRGQVVTSYERIAEGCDMSVSNVRRCLKNLEETGEITRVHTNRFQIITVSNYDRYQSDLSKMNRQTNSQKNTQTNTQSDSQTNSQTNTDIRNKEIKKLRSKEGNKGRSAPGSPSGEIHKEIPDEFKDRFRTYEEYYAWRYQ